MSNKHCTRRSPNYNQRLGALVSSEAGRMLLFLFISAVLPAREYLCTICMQCKSTSEEGIRYAGTGLTDGCKKQCGLLRLESHSCGRAVSALA